MCGMFSESSSASIPASPMTKTLFFCFSWGCDCGRILEMYMLAEYEEPNTSSAVAGMPIDSSFLR